MTAGLQYLVSIVTPVYNEAEHLPECIESVLAQTYSNWEYIIVDNCSTDGSVEIARRYAERDRRIRVVESREFLRAIPNHNRALRQISKDSKYCKVVLSDDWIFPECLERMVALAEEYPSAGIVGAYALEGDRVAWTGLPYSSKLVSGKEACRLHFVAGLHVFGTANSVLYRSDIIRKRASFYNESNIHADTEVCFAILKEWDFGFVHQVLSFTRIRPGSLNDLAGSMETSLGAMLHLLVTYGPEYLTSLELEACLERHLRDYYRFLGKSVLLRRDGKFWDYHKRSLIEAGVGYSRFRLLANVLAELGGAVLNPKLSTERLLRKCDVRL